VRNTDEHYEQSKFVKWFRERYPSVRIFAIPNGTHISTINARMWQKAEGLESGVPDLFIPEWLVWVEMKKKGYKTPKTLSKTEANQKIWHEYLTDVCRHKVYQACGFEEAMEYILSNRLTVGNPSGVGKHSRAIENDTGQQTSSSRHPIQGEYPVPFPPLS